MLREDLIQTLNDIADEFNNGFLNMRQAMKDLESLITEVEGEDDGGTEMGPHP